jgi:glutamine synthetase
VLLAKRAVFERYGVFPAGVIYAQAEKLKGYDDKGLSDRILGNEKVFGELVSMYIHVA